MIDKIHIKGLKSINELTVNCSKFNLLAGTNSSGKSTFLQSVLTAVQGDINGELVSLGEFREARNYNMSGQEISIELWGDGKKDPYRISFSEQESGAYRIETPVVDDIINGMTDADYKPDRMNLPEYGTNFFYLSCDRTGANDIYAKNFSSEKDFGTRGEYALSYLLSHEGKPVDSTVEIQNPDITNSLLDQVNHWMKYIIGTTLQITDLKKTNYLQVKYNNNPMITSETMFCRPANVGSGVSYLVSIIIVCLASGRGSTILIENPEIHLHPKAQSRLCEFLYLIAESGRQIFVETHSDHLFNGLRVGVSSGKMKMENISVSFFALDDHFETQCNPIIFGEYGRIIGKNERMNLKDLFDQFEIDLDSMLGL